MSMQGNRRADEGRGGNGQGFQPVSSDPTIKQVIENGSNRWSRIIGHATIQGVEVRLRVRISGWSAAAEYTDATRENDTWHQLGGSYPQNTTFSFLLHMLPCVAQLRLLPAVLLPNPMQVAESAVVAESRDDDESDGRNYLEYAWEVK